MSTLNRLISGILIFSGISLAGMTQQDPQYSQYMFSQMVYNPGYAGSSEMICANMLHREQWIGFDGAPSTTLFRANMPVNPFGISSGVGLVIMNDKAGFSSNLNISAAYAYRMNVGNGKLGIGLSFGFINNTLEPNWYIPTIVHEFCHSYVNPLVDQYKEMLHESGERIFPSHKEKLSQSGYNYWYVMMYEYLTRACVVRYLYANEGVNAANRQMKWDERYGFPAITGLVKLLNDYENNRDRYPHLEAFMPVIAEYFNQTARIKP